MSHMATKKTKPGEPVIVDLEAVKLAALNLGMNCEERTTYEWWGHSVGDYPIPAGFTKEELGKNAVLVLSLSEAQRLEAEKVYGRGVKPYELAVVADPANPGCWTLMCDFFNGGYGLSGVVGAPIGEGDAITIAPLLMMHYRMCADALSAREAGDSIRFEAQADGSWVSYTDVAEDRLRG